MMGQIVKTKKRGRQPKADSDTAAERELRRSLRRRNVKYVFDLDDYFDEDDELFENDEDHRQNQKKLNLLLNLQQKSPNCEDDDEDDNKPSKKLKIDDDNYSEEVREGKPEEDSPPGTPTEAPSPVQLPDKKALELILDKLQKIDVYGVYAEPVDPEELPNYHEKIEHPMDFATVRSKLGNGSYATLEQFESDVFLICSNAMQYNERHTIYHKQARSIKKLAKKKFSKIRMNIDRTGKEMMPEHKMGCSSILKKQVERSVSQLVEESIGSDFSSGATLATPVDIQNVPNALLAVEYERPGSIEGLAAGNSFLNDNNLDKGEESLPGKGPLSRFGRKSFIHDENRRATCNISLAHPVGDSEPIFSTFEEESKLLVPVGLYSDHSYARSLACFAATLGSVAWKVACKKIEQALPEGIKFGRGWVGEYEPLPTCLLMLEMLENCVVKEPDVFAKVQEAPSPMKFEKTPTVSEFPEESQYHGPGMEKNIPFLGAAGIRPPSASITTASVPVKEHPTRGSISEVNPSFFLNTGINPHGSSILSYEHQNSQSRTSTESDNKTVVKQAELNGPSSFSKDAATCNGITRRELANGIFVCNRLDNSAIASSSDEAKAAICYPQEQGQGITDPVQLMRMLASNQEQSSNQSLAVAPQVFSSPPFSDSIDPNNGAAAAAARVWMSVGAGGFRPAGQNTNLLIKQSYADSLHNSTHEVSQFRGDFPSAGMQVQVPNRKNSPINPFAPQAALPMTVGNTIQFRDQQKVFPQLVTSDLFRFQVPPTWQNPCPQMHSGQKSKSLPPDLNIGCQSSGSPGRPSSCVLVDSQQPDLALQL